MGNTEGLNGSRNGESTIDQSSEKPIFDEVYFAVIPSGRLNEQELIAKLIEHGATHCPLSSSDLHNITHLISNTSDFPAYHDAVEAYIHVVRSVWVEQSILKKKTPNPRHYSPDPRLFLSDVVLTFTEDVPQTDKDNIVGGLVAFGGQYSAHLTRLVTHIVTLSADNQQCRIAAAKRLPAKPVLPHWFDDCLKLGKKLSHEPYLLPNPPLLSDIQDKLPRFTSPTAITGATLRDPPEPEHFRPPISPSKHRRELAVFRNKKIVFHVDLALSERLKKSLSTIIQNGGGKVVASIYDAHVLICQYRDSTEFKVATTNGLEVGNIGWLYYLINHNSWTDPSRRLLHYPFPKEGIEAFKDFKIAISNYTGEARVYIESLIKAAGGEYTKTMSQENTHLITAHLLSEKSTAAKEWDIQLVNHLWLEESYASMRTKAVTEPKYTTFPSRTNLCEVVGQTSIDRLVIKQMYFPESKPAATERPDDVDSTVARTPLTSEPRVTNLIPRDIQTPLPSRMKGEKMAVHKIDTPGSRGAKERALTKLHAMAPDIALFQKEIKRVGGVVYGGRRVTDPDRIMLDGPQGHKRSSSVAEMDEPDVVEVEAEQTASETEEPRKKKHKKSKPSVDDKPVIAAPKLSVLLTGILHDSRAHSSFKSKLRDLNITILEDATTKVDVIAAPRILRTKKFLLGIANGPEIVNSQWLDDMVERKQRLPVEDYVLKDVEYEQNSHLNLQEAVKLARNNKRRGGMLKDWTILCTIGAKGGFSTFEDIIKANGGRCLLYKGRETTITRDRDQENIEGDWMEVDGDDGAVSKHRSQTTQLYLITDEKDKALWPKFQNFAIKEGYEAKIVTPDWMLRIALSQQVDDWQDDWLLS